MKKSLVAISITILLLISVLPVISANGDDGMSGNITYAPGGGNVEPIKILAIWETNGESYLDDDYYSPGCQIDPPMHWDWYSTVWVYLAVYDPDDDIQYNQQIKVDISWPDNDLSGRPDLGDGSKAFDNLEPVLDATWAEYAAADAIDYGCNSPFICYYNYANDEEYPDGYDYVYWQYYESNVKFFKAKYEPYYHDPAGWYDAEVTVQGSWTDFQMNYFEYVYCLGFQTDFEHIDWGNEHLLNVWHAYDGNWDWDFPPIVLPTIKNIGNWDTVLGCHFSAGDFNVNDVLFDWRAGDSNPESPKYNPTYSEENGIAGMVPCNWNYWPLPIDNDFWLGEDTNYDDVLLKCHKLKLDFYIKVLQWTNGPGEYSWCIDIYTGNPSWQPEPGYPCPNGIQQ
jgi:hypothetical protein